MKKVYDEKTKGEVNMKAVKQYNDLMMDICHEHVTIGTRFSEGTENWNLRDMVSEVAYVLDLWNDSGSIAWLDAHDDSQPADRPWYKDWLNEKARMKRFIDKYKDEAMEMECTEGHSSVYD